MGLDRRTETSTRRAVLAPEIHTARPEERLVESESPEGTRPQGGGQDDATRSRGDRTRETRWPLGARLRVAEQGDRTGGPRDRPRRQPPRREVLRDARLAQSIRRAVSSELRKKA